MQRYTTYGKFQEEMNNYHEKTGLRLQFMEMISRMEQKGLLSETPIGVRIPDDAQGMSDEEFDKIVDKLPISVRTQDANTPTVSEDKMIPNFYDVFTIRHPRFTRRFSHSHNYFELNFVVKGEAEFYFEDTKRIMHEGEVCIVAPGSTHDFLINDDSSIIHTICIRRSTFDSTFSSIMSHQDLLSGFFRQMLKNDDKSNYLMLFTGNNLECRILLRKLLIESAKKDEYSNGCCISIINLFFCNLLRNYSKTIAFYNYEIGSDFSLVLQYIQHNYQNITLASLADFLHYSEPHLCTLIKQNTGETFTELIKNLRMKDAVNFLINTDIKINEIAEQVGYNSADHFSRVFRQTYKCSPAEYRKNYKKESPFIPFSTEQEQRA